MLVQFVWIPLALPKFSLYRNCKFLLLRKFYGTKIKVGYRVFWLSPILLYLAAPYTEINMHPPSSRYVSGQAACNISLFILLGKRGGKIKAQRSIPTSSRSLWSFLETFCHGKEEGLKWVHLGLHLILNLGLQHSTWGLICWCKLELNYVWSIPTG